jgi:hypothetical protein
MDCVNCRCRNLQKVNTIEIFFTINTNDRFVIEYSFHSIDFNYWKEIVKIHKENVTNPRLFDELGNEVGEDEIENKSEYYNFILISEDFNLYRNINLTFFFDKPEDITSTQNLDIAMRKNTWSS